MGSAVFAEPAASPVCHRVHPLSVPGSLPWYPFSPESIAPDDIVVTRGGRSTRTGEPINMPLTRGFLLSCCTAGLIFAQSVPPKQLTARELFYAAPQTPTPRPPAKRAVRPPAKPVEIARATTRPRPQPATAPMPATGAPPLGLRYTILKNRRRQHPHRSPQRHRLSRRRSHPVKSQTNQPGYLYIISQGSSGTWKPMFPSAEVEDGSNHVDGWHVTSCRPSRASFLTSRPASKSC